MSRHRRPPPQPARPLGVILAEEPQPHVIRGGRLRQAEAAMRLAHAATAHASALLGPQSRRDDETRHELAAAFEAWSRPAGGEP